MNRFINKENKAYIISLLLSILAALFIGSLIILLNGKSPIVGLQALIKGSFDSNYRIANTISRTAPLVLTGLATAVAFKAGIFNIGGEGQLYLGAFMAAFIGISFPNIPGFLGMATTIVLGALVGGLYAFLPGHLKVEHNIDEVITTMMLNSAAMFFTSYLVNSHFSAADSKMAATDLIYEQYRFSKLVPLSTLNTSVVLVIIMVIALYYLLTKTTKGYEINMVGQNPQFARYGGINDKSLMIRAMILSGIICGIAGVFEVTGTHYRFLQKISPELAFDGMLVALVVNNNPLGIILMGFFFGAMKTGSVAMENATEIPAELIDVIQSIIILFIAGEMGFRKKFQQYKLNRKPKEVKEDVENI